MSAYQGRGSITMLHQKLSNVSGMSNLIRRWNHQESRCKHQAGVRRGEALLSVHRCNSIISIGSVPTCRRDIVLYAELSPLHVAS